MRKTLLVLALISSLSGCGVMQQYQMQQAQQQHDQKMAQFGADMDAAGAVCKNQLETDVRLNPIRGHINFNGGDPTLEQLASTKKPTAKEKPAILAWDQISSACLDSRIEINDKYNLDPAYSQNIRNTKRLQTQLRANLWAGQITYGQYLKSAQENIAAYRKENIAIAERVKQKIRQEQMQQAQINAVNAQAAAAVMSAQAQQQSANAQTMMMFNQAQQQQRQQFNAPGTATNPVQTNCNRIGNSVNCQTYSY